MGSLCAPAVMRAWRPCHSCAAPAAAQPATSCRKSGELAVKNWAPWSKLRGCPSSSSRREDTLLAGHEKEERGDRLGCQQFAFTSRKTAHGRCVLKSTQAGERVVASSWRVLHGCQPRAPAAYAASSHIEQGAGHSSANHGLRSRHPGHPSANYGYPWCCRGGGSRGQVCHMGCEAGSDRCSAFTRSHIFRMVVLLPDRKERWLAGGRLGPARHPPCMITRTGDPSRTCIAKAR